MNFWPNFGGFLLGWRGPKSLFAITFNVPRKQGIVDKIKAAIVLVERGEGGAGIQCGLTPGAVFCSSCSPLPKLKHSPSPFCKVLNLTCQKLQKSIYLYSRNLLHIHQHFINYYLTDNNY